MSPVIKARPAQAAYSKLEHRQEEELFEYAQWTRKESRKLDDRSGVLERNHELAGRLAGQVEAGIQDGATTGEVYKLAFKLLAENDTPSATRFGLKLAIMRLGPTGFPFEKYVSEILREHGYKTSINQYLDGMCVEHEVDVIAEKDGLRYMIECKYHNQGGFTTGLKEALYTWARYQDLCEAGQEFHCAWIFTNTKCSTTAIKYGDGKGMKFTSWGHPPGESLQELIESDCLYPITILRTVTEDMKNRLADHGIMLVKDLKKLAPERLSNVTGRPARKLEPLLNELKEITLEKQKD
ncbi:restriction endonuclease [Candidatus Altiarchaeota archaeon]